MIETTQPKVVYTAIFGRGDDLVSPDFPKSIDTLYVCFTDRTDLVSDFWRVIRISDASFPRAKAVFDHFVVTGETSPTLAMLKNRELKMFPESFISGAKMTAYLDGHVRLRACFSALLEKALQNADWSSPRHRYGGNTLIEALRCLDQNKISTDELKTFFNKIISVGIDSAAPMPENGLIFRRHGHRNVVEMGRIWWELFSHGPFRDQLHWQHAHKLSGVNFSYLPHSFDEHNESYYLHRHKRNIFNMIVTKYKFLSRKSFLKK